MIRILIAGAGGAAAANFVRSLKFSDKKFYIVGTDTNKYHLELAQIDKKYLIAPASSRSYIGNINKIIKKEGIDIVYPQSDSEVYMIAANRKHIQANTFLPSTDIISLCQNKKLLTEKLDNSGIPVAKSISLGNKQQIAEFIRDHKKVWIRAIRGAGSKAALPVTSTLQVSGWVDYWKSRGLVEEDFIVSEYLSGREYAFQGIWKNGELVVSAARERIEYLFGSIMPSGQSSSPSVARSVHSSKVNRIAEKAVRSIDPFPNGVYSVDLKENSYGVPCITEINAGRFFTTSFFFTKAGCNMPYAYVQLALGRELSSMSKFNAVKKDQYWLRMIDMGEKLVVDNKWASKKI